MEDKDEFDNAVQYFQSIIHNTISNYSPHKMGATFIGIKTNISGVFKLHIYILLFPFVKNETVVPYSNSIPNMYFKDVCFDVGVSFYFWLYQEMKTQNSIVILSLESNIFKVVPKLGDTLISIENEKKEWIELDYEDWYTKQTFNTIFTIKITNPFLYVVPFPVKPIIVKTVKRINNYIDIL